MNFLQGLVVLEKPVQRWLVVLTAEIEEVFGQEYAGIAKSSWLGFKNCGARWDMESSWMGWSKRVSPRKRSCFFSEQIRLVREASRIR